MGNQFIKKARILVTSKGSRSIIGGEWLSTLRYKFEPVIEGESEVNSIKEDEELCEETKKCVSEFKKLFTRNEKVKNHQVRNKLKEDSRIVQQKGRLTPIQLQNAVDAEVKRLLKHGQIEKVSTLKDDVFLTNSNHSEDRSFSKNSVRCKNP